MTKENIENKRVSILGMARSGMALAFMLNNLGARVFVSESAENETVSKNKFLLDEQGIPNEIGGHSEKILQSDFIAISPGVPVDIDILKVAKNRGIPIFSELEVSSWFCNSPIIAITGSNGKTTTTTLIGKILSDSNIENIVGGNIGIPFASFIDKICPDGYAVLEVSSFQLERIDRFKPKVAVILNFTPDHLDRYATLDDYRYAKARIYENLGKGDYLILNADDRESDKFMPKPEVKLLRFSNRNNDAADIFVKGRNLVLKTAKGIEPIIPTKEIGIKGPHNVANSAAAVLVGIIAGAEITRIADSLRRFKGVEHRLEKVMVIDGITYINDSKGTNVDAVLMALKSVEGNVVLIAGGKDKGGDFTKLIPDIKGKVCALVLIGEAADKISMQLSGIVSTYRAESMDDAVLMAAKLARRGETVLLSPGCASFDMFDNYEHRGKVFKEAVYHLKSGELV